MGFVCKARSEQKMLIDCIILQCVYIYYIIYNILAAVSVSQNYVYK